MATAKGIEITAIDANPQVLREAGSMGGKVRVAMDTIAAGTGDIDDNDVLLLAQVPSNAKIMSIQLFNDDLDSNCTPTLTANCGIYNGPQDYTISGTRTAANAVVDEDCYATAITTLQAANTAGVELAYEVRNVNAVANHVWEDAGISEDPHVDLRIGLTMSANPATAAAGDVTMVVTYAVN